MKKLAATLLVLICTSIHSSFGQVPGITYQAVILSSDGKALPGINHSNFPLADQDVCLQFSFLNQAGDYEYQEVIQTKTDPLGMVNVIIGKGNQVGGSAASFDKIPWSIAAKFLEVSLDKSGTCTEFSLISKQEFTAVPFALFSVNSGTTDSEITQGKSAYQIWIDLGNIGTEQDFLKSLKGPTGPQGLIGATGAAGQTGATGPTGAAGTNGLSAYQVWLGLGNTGTEANFIASLTGPSGLQGPAGAAGVAGPQGTAGQTGATGPAGAAGNSGLSAYQVWLGLGNTGTEANFIASLSGPSGPQGPAGVAGVAGPQGAIGPVGPQGPAGADGVAASAATFVDLSTNQSIGGTKTFTNPIAGSITGNAATVTTNANLTGVVTSSGNVTAIANGVITNAMLANGAVANLSGTNTGDQTATTVSNTAAGTIAATTVQGALNELDTEKSPLASPTFTGTVTIPTLVAGTNTFPTSSGNNNQVLSTNGSGTLTWTTPSASLVSNSAAGTIAATDVQTALNELDTEKAPLASPTFTGSLKVNGAASNSQAKVYAASETSLDFSLSNLISTNASAGSFTLLNMRDGGTYTLAVTGGISGTATFTHSGLTFNSLRNVATTTSKTALYTFIVIGDQVYFSMISIQ